ncbi:agmatinase, partial [bacterium]|nr:agmatinase [bacterium]
FLDIPESSAAEADVLVLPLPFEGTVTYGKGTAAGPEAIWQASTQLELYDEELDADLDQLKYHSAPAVEPAQDEPVVAYLEKVYRAAFELHGSRGLVVGVGGEHSLTPPLVRAAIARRKIDPSALTVVQIDAHADLRQEYENTPHSHACAMRRVLDLGARVLAIGIRSADRAEADFGKQCRKLRTFGAQALATDAMVELDLIKTLSSVSGPVYLTIDIDGLDPALCPATGTPQPGGLEWWPTLRYLRTLIQNPNIQLVGFDVCETVPQAGTLINEFTAIKLLAKVVLYHAFVNLK